eukprot:SAG11_NODE_2381_length_3426_cov_2.697507_6_plen_93_part_00
MRLPDACKSARVEELARVSARPDNAVFEGSTLAGLRSVSGDCPPTGAAPIAGLNIAATLEATFRQSSSQLAIRRASGTVNRRWCTFNTMQTT